VWVSPDIMRNMRNRIPPLPASKKALCWSTSCAMAVSSLLTRPLS
jgi:hypothetical protein